MEIQIKGHTVLIDEQDYAFVSNNVWYISNSGYVYGHINNESISLHRFLLGLARGNRLTVDHINQNKLDNRRSNLRACTQQLNSFNRMKHGITSKFKGVSRSFGAYKFAAFITFNYKTVRIFTSKNEIECAYAYNYATKLLNISYPYINQIPELTDEIKQAIEHLVTKRLDKHLTNK